jgi:hypothetical protein
MVPGAIRENHGFLRTDTPKDTPVGIPDADLPMTESCAKSDYESHCTSDDLRHYAGRSFSFLGCIRRLITILGLLDSLDVPIGMWSEHGPK